MTLAIHNTLTREKAPFVPIEPGRVRLYVCGMTVYDYCHLGHGRVLVAFDAVVRFLRARGYTVAYVRNITDVDDKILQRAAEIGEPHTALTERFIQAMWEDCAALGLLPPDQEPRATEHIDDMQSMIQVLLDKDYAYVADNGDVYYRVARFADYGKLSGKKPDELQAGARVAVDEAKEDPRDFALWKAAAEGEVSWPSPWGPGRPGWHIECSAMSTDCLGDHFDIHGGGPDLVFPHHENEIAQSEAATGQPYANVWMHAGAVRVNDEKMSKSLGNFFTLREVLAEYAPEVVRYFLLASHYRSPIHYSDDNLAQARHALTRLYQALREFPGAETRPLSALDPDDLSVHRFIAAMEDDFNTPEALSVLFDLARELNIDQKAPTATLLRSLGGVLGLLQQDPVDFLQGVEAGGLDAATIEALIAERQAAKQARDFARADAIRDQLQADGVVLEDTREGTQWRRA